MLANNFNELKVNATLVFRFIQIDVRNTREKSELTHGRNLRYEIRIFENNSIYNDVIYVQHSLESESSWSDPRFFSSFIPRFPSFLPFLRYLHEKLFIKLDWIVRCQIRRDQHKLGIVRKFEAFDKFFNGIDFFGNHSSLSQTIAQHSDIQIVHVRYKSGQSFLIQHHTIVRLT